MKTCLLSVETWKQEKGVRIIKSNFSSLVIRREIVLKLLSQVCKTLLYTCPHIHALTCIVFIKIQVTLVLVFLKNFSVSEEYSNSLNLATTKHDESNHTQRDKRPEGTARAFSPIKEKGL